MPLEHTLVDCPQNPTLGHILESLKRLDAHGERTALAMEKMASNSATLDAHSDKLKQHDAAFIELFNWRREFVDKQDKDYRTNLEKISELEKVKAINDAVEQVVEDGEEKKFKFWTVAEAKLKIATPFVMVAFFAIWLIDRTGFAVAVLKLVKEFSK